MNEGSETPDVKEISQTAKIKDLYFDLLKSSKKEIMLIIPTNKAFERQERTIQKRGTIRNTRV